MFYDALEDDLDDPPMPSTFVQDTPALPKVDTPVVASDWNEDMLPVRVRVHPESHLEIESSLSTSQISAQTLVMIDSGATSEFINSSLVQRLGIPLLAKSRPRHLYTVDGSHVKGGSVTHEVEITLRMKDHSEIVRLDVADIGRHEIILGMPWLVRHNPFVDWERHRISFVSVHCSQQCLASRADVHGVASASIHGVPKGNGHPSVTIEDEEEPSVTK